MPASLSRLEADRAECGRGSRKRASSAVSRDQQDGSGLRADSVNPTRKRCARDSKLPGRRVLAARRSRRSALGLATHRQTSRSSPQMATDYVALNVAIGGGYAAGRLTQ